MFSSSADFPGDALLARHKKSFCLFLFHPHFLKKLIADSVSLLYLLANWKKGKKEKTFLVICWDSMLNYMVPEL